MVFATSPTSFSSLRPPLLRLARLGANYPIEVIVTVFCAVTLVYFQLLKVSPTLDLLCYSRSTFEIKTPLCTASYRRACRVSSVGHGRSSGLFCSNACIQSMASWSGRSRVRPRSNFKCLFEPIIAAQTLISRGLASLEIVKCPLRRPSFARREWPGSNSGWSAAEHTAAVLSMYRSRSKPLRCF